MPRPHPFLVPLSAIAQDLKLRKACGKDDILASVGDVSRVGKGKRYRSLFIGPESDHCSPLSLTDSLTNSLTHSCLVNLTDVTLACEDANSELVEVVTVADFDAEDHVGNSLLAPSGALIAIPTYY